MKSFGHFILTAFSAWTMLFVSLWVLDLSGVLAAMPGQIAYSFTFLMLVIALLLISVRAAELTASARDGWVGAIFAVAGIGLAMQVLSPGLLLAWLAGGCLIAGGMRLCASLGHEVISATYFWPLTLVVILMDSWSVLSPDGITHQIVHSVQTTEQFNFMLLTVPIPGIGLEPILGMGDVLFVAFMAGAVAHLNLSSQKYLTGAGIGFILCLIALLIWQQPLPALTFVAPAIAIALGREAASTTKEVLTAVVFVAVLFGVKTLVLG